MLKLLRDSLKTPDSNLNRIAVWAYTLVCPLLSLYIYNLNHDLSPLSNEVHKDKLESKDDISQTCVGRDLALQQGDSVPTSRLREVNFETMQHAKLRSVLRRIVELERRLGVMRDNRFLRRERIQLGLVAGQRRVSASEFPYMMVLLALIVVIISGTYKYFAFSESA
jgi:hypothetical protein